MTNFDIARDSLSTAKYDSEGSAEKELENWNKGVEASIAHFQAQFQELATTVLNSDFLKGLIDAGTVLLNIITQIVDKLGMIPTIMAGVGVTTFIKNLDHQKVLKILPRILSWSSIDKEAIKWFAYKSMCLGVLK